MRYCVNVNVKKILFTKVWKFLLDSGGIIIGTVGKPLPRSVGDTGRGFKIFVIVN